LPFKIIRKVAIGHFCILPLPFAIHRVLAVNMQLPKTPPTALDGSVKYRFEKYV